MTRTSTATRGRFFLTHAAAFAVVGGAGLRAAAPSEAVVPTPLPTRSGIAIVATTTSAAPTTTIARHGFAVVDAGVFWPTIDEELSRLVTIKPFASSDHRLVWVDLA